VGAGQVHAKKPIVAIVRQKERVFQSLKNAIGLRFGSYKAQCVLPVHFDSRQRDDIATLLMGGYQCPGVEKRGCANGVTFDATNLPITTSMSARVVTNAVKKLFNRFEFDHNIPRKEGECSIETAATYALSISTDATAFNKKRATVSKSPEEIQTLLDTLKDDIKFSLLKKDLYGLNRYPRGGGIVLLCRNCHNETAHPQAKLKRYCK
jgi:hypothetical protein